MCIWTGGRSTIACGRPTVSIHARCEEERRERGVLDGGGQQARGIPQEVCEAPVAWLEGQGSGVYRVEGRRTRSDLNTECPRDPPSLLPTPHIHY